MKRLFCLLILSFGLFGCDRDPETTTIQMPIHLAPQKGLIGDWQLKVTVSSPEMDTVMQTIPLTVDPEQGGVQQVTIPNLLVGDTVNIKVEILADGQLVSERSQSITLLDSAANTVSFEMDKLVEEKPEPKPEEPEPKEEEKEEEKEEKPKKLPDKITWQKDGSKMVLIPGGSFQMGDHFNEGTAWERPVHKVKLDGFYMDSHEITVGQFKRFLKESGYKPEAVKRGWDINRLWNEVKKWSPTDKHPVVYVSWNDATAYAKWSGKRLPTEAEWEYAARGGRVGKRYPWGDDKKVARDCANYSDTGGRDKWSKCAPVGSFKPNGYGLYDMAGNVWEWCQDWYDGNYYTISPAENPPGPGTGKRRVLRGGHWYNNTSLLRVAYRANSSPDNRYNSYGFRCVSGLR
ncbi:MAG: formylglycine-generating enzyme family protein [Candidatus Poribacteria bacterium]|nr:formylglycine-generating enzyme family protein [Candidatus Poribacteria bacterium]